MDRNQVIGFILIAVMFIVYFQFFVESPPPEEPGMADSTRTEQAPETTTTQPAQSTESEETFAPVNDSLVNTELQARYGDFAVLAQGEARSETIENSKLSVQVNSKGGQIELVSLKDYVTHDGEPLHLVEPERNRFSWVFKDLQGRSIDLGNLYYSIRKSGNNKLTLNGDLGSGKRVVITYELEENSYEVNSEVKFDGLQNIITSEDLTFGWLDRIKNQEKDVTISRNNSTIKYLTVSGDHDYIGERHLDLREENINEPVKWLSIKQKFFTAAILPEKQFNKAYISTIADETDTTTVKIATINASYPAAEMLVGAKFRYFFGPNDYGILKSVADDFGKNLYLGWPPVNLVNRFILIPLFNLLSSFIGNYGIIIIIMVFIIKLVLSPLSYKSYLSMAKMKVLKPELDEIKEKHPDDMTKAQQEQMKLYRQVGVNPLSGCIPLLLQMPILFAMFYLFPQSIELRQKGFLWADDLSTYDAVINLPFYIPGYGDHISLFVLLMTASTILYTWSNNQVSTVQGPMKSFSYMMPIIFMFVLNRFPAALSFYYLVSNLVTFGQQAIIRRFVDEEKIKSILNLNRKKNANKKKSSFQVRLEEAMKAGDAKKKKKK